jgi:hypothetical protein
MLVFLGLYGFALWATNRDPDMLRIVIASSGTVGICSLVVVLGQPAPSGVELMVKVEARRLAGQDVSEQTLQILEAELPGDGAEVRYITDGRAVREHAVRPHVRVR